MFTRKKCRNAVLRTWLVSFLLVFILGMFRAENVSAATGASSAPSSSKEETTEYLPLNTNGKEDIVGRYQFNYTGNWNYFSNINSVYGYEDEVRRNTYLAGYQNSSGATLTNSSGATGIVKAYLIWETRQPYVQSDESANHVRFIMRDGRSGINVYPDYVYNDNRKFSDWGNTDLRTCYTMVADVTNLVKAYGYGDYYVANIPEYHSTTTGGDNMCSWQLVVVEEGNNFPVRALTLKVGAKWRFGDAAYGDTSYLDTNVAFSNGIKSKSSGSVSGQLLFGCANDHDSTYTNLATTLYTSDSSGNRTRVAGSTLYGGGLYKNGGKQITEYGIIADLRNVSSGLGNNATVVGAEVNNIYWNTLLYVGTGIDIAFPDLRASQTTKVNSATSVIVTGSINNNSTSANTGIYSGKLVVTIDSALAPTSAQVVVNGQTINGTISGNTVTFNGVQTLTSGNTITYTVVCSVKDSSKSTYTNSDVFSGYMRADGVNTGYWIDKASTSSSSAVMPKSTLVVNPNGGVWNGSTKTQSFTKSYSETLAVNVPTRAGWEFVKWVKSSPFYGSLASDVSNATYTFGASNGVKTTITAQWKDITPPVAEITAVTDASGNYTTATYTNVFNGKFWFKDFLDAQITSSDGTGSGIKANYLSNANSASMLSSSNNPYARNYLASETDSNGALCLNGYALDNADNKGEADTKYFYVDGTAPIIASVSAVDAGSESGISVQNDNGMIVVASTSDIVWRNVDVNVTVGIYDTQAGLMSAVLERYDDASGMWYSLNMVSYNGEIDMQTATFTITETGKYRIAVYDMLSHVSYTNEAEYYIDKIPPTIDVSTQDPTIIVEEQEYGWTNKEVPLHFDIAENINGSGIDTLTFVKVLEDGTEQDIPITANIGADAMNATVDTTITEEGKTFYKFYAKDKAGNQSYVFITVKIDYTAPTANVETVLDDDCALDVSLNDIVEELSGCDLEETYFTISDTEGIVPDVLEYRFNPDDYTNIHTGASFSKLDIDVLTKFESCDSINVEIHLFDIAGNEQVYTNTVDIFKLEATLYRYLSEIDGNTGDYALGETWRAGESGLVKIDASAFVDRIEVIYPTEWIIAQDADVTYPLDQFENIYTYNPPVVRNHEEDEFMIPTGIDDDNVTYTIVVRAYKVRNGVERMKEVELPLIVKDSVLDDLRTRIRYRQYGDGN